MLNKKKGSCIIYYKKPRNISLFADWAFVIIRMAKIQDRRNGGFWVTTLRGAASQLESLRLLCEWEMKLYTQIICFDLFFFTGSGFVLHKGFLSPLTNAWWLSKVKDNSDGEKNEAKISSDRLQPLTSFASLPCSDKVPSLSNIIPSHWICF